MSEFPPESIQYLYIGIHDLKKNIKNKPQNQRGNGRHRREDKGS